MGIASRSNRTFNDINRKARTIPRSIDAINRRLDSLRKTRRLSVDLRQIKAADREISHLKRELKTLNRGGASNGGSGLGGMLGMSSRLFLPMAVAAGAYRAGSYALGAGSEHEQAKVGLSTFLGDDADRAFKNIQSDAASTPFDVQSLLMVNRSLISAGTNADNARADALALGNAIAAVGGGNDGLSRMAANMQQIKTVGKATAMDIRQFGMTGINIYGLLADATGKSVDEVKKMEVGYDLLSYALRKASMEGGLYFGAMEAQSKTLNGQWNTMWDNLRNDAGEAVTILHPVITSILGVGQAWYATIGKWIKQWAIAVRLTGLGFSMMWNKFTLWNMKMIHGIQEIGYKIAEVVDLGIQKFGNLAEAGYRAMHFDFKGAGEAWNREEKSSFTGKLNQKKGDHFWEQTWLGADITKQKAQIGYLMQDMNALSAGGKKTQSLAEVFKAAGDSKKAFSFSGSTAASGKGKSKLKHAAHKATNNITGGGVRNIHINLGKFQDSINIHTTTLKEGVSEMEKMVENSLLRILNSAGAIK